MKKENQKETDKNQTFSDEWGAIEIVSYNQKTGQPVPRPKDYDEVEY
jgi:hypothetical protein